MKAYIISYFGVGEARSKRVEYHTKQLEWLNQNGFQNSDIRISYRDYLRDELVAGITYSSKSTTGIQGIVDSRNEMLREFYKSNDDWGMFCDNDTILDDRNKGDILTELRNGNLFSTVGIFVPINPATPGRGAFNKVWEMDPVDNNWVFKRGNTSGKMMFIKNIKKHHGQEIYFKPFPAGEDIMFGYEFAKLGLASMWCHNIVLFEFAKKASEEMVWKDPSDTTSRHEYSELYKKTAVDNFAGMEIVSGKLMTKRFFEKHNVNTKIVCPKISSLLSNFMEKN